MSKITKFKKIKHEISCQLYDIKYDGDLSDLGNEIGVVLGKHFKSGEMGYELIDFIRGFMHGISLSDGTHPKIKD